MDHVANQSYQDSQTKFPWDFFLLVFAITVPFWIIGGSKLPLPINLPVSALATFNPLIAAAILIYRRDGMQGVRKFLLRVLDYRRFPDKRWLLPVLFILPLLFLVAYFVMRLVGLPLPDPVQVPLLLAPALFVIFFITDAGEELGWTGYATDPMQNRWGPLKASFLLGIIWAAWHFIPFLQTGSSLSWVIWQSIYTVLIRVLTVWFYNRCGKSVFAANLIHVMSNLSWSLFPNYGSHYNPAVTAPILLLVIIAALIWEQKSVQLPA
jgi:membrane protease YdiL (CAAX protease family)